LGKTKSYTCFAPPENSTSFGPHPCTYHLDAAPVFSAFSRALMLESARQPLTSTRMQKVVFLVIGTYLCCAFHTSLLCSFVLHMLQKVLAFLFNSYQTFSVPASCTAVLLPTVLSTLHVLPSRLSFPFRNTTNTFPIISTSTIHALSLPSNFDSPHFVRKPSRSQSSFDGTMDLTFKWRIGLEYISDRGLQQFIVSTFKVEFTSTKIYSLPYRSEPT